MLLRLATCTLRNSGRFTTSRFASTLVLVEHNGSQVTPATLSTITAAGKLGGDITALVAGDNCDAVVKHASEIKGVSKVIHAKSGSLNNGLPELFQPLLSEIQTNNSFSHIISAHSSFGKNILPRFAAELDVSQVSDIVEIQSEDTFVRPIYAGNAMATVQSEDSVKICTIRPTAFDKAETGGSATVEVMEPSHKSDASEWLSEEISKSDRPELTSADIVVAGGRALKNKETFDSVMYPFADSIGAAVGASRAAVDANYCANELQIGQTGKVIAPALYIGVGISGAIQHVAGMKDSKKIVVINKDAEAPFFSIADHGLVADLYQAVPEFIEKVKAAKN